MSLNLDKTAWKRVTLRDVVRHVTDRVDAETSGLERFLAGEHIPSGSLSITDWGVIGRDPIGPMFYKRFKPGHVLYVSRRTYLRKVAVPEFEGITGEKTFVLETLDENALMQEFLPFVLSAERFHAYAIAHSRGSVNPYLNWGELAAYEFDLPPRDEQQRLADLLWAPEFHGQGLAATDAALRSTRKLLVRDRLARVAELDGVARLDSLIEADRPITYGILMPGSGVEDGVPVIKVKDFPDGRIREGQLLLTTEEIAHEYRRSTLKQGDLIISIRGTIGRLAEVPAPLVGANITQDTARLSVDPKHDRRYVRLALESEYCQRQIRRRATGTGVLGLNLGALRKIEVPMPSDRSIAEGIIREAEALTKATDETAVTRSHLAALRAALSAEIFGGAE
ncbi:hypothetical protein [[Kitasatospora] papulosa]|uniref:hypothetical protein n=1 Tax=[Kitasatospora] papulosa TaxID=1464011 RepID=UPI0036D1C917